MASSLHGIDEPGAHDVARPCPRRGPRRTWAGPRAAWSGRRRGSSAGRPGRRRSPADGVGLALPVLVDELDVELGVLGDHLLDLGRRCRPGCGLPRTGSPGRARTGRCGRPRGRCCPPRCGRGRPPSPTADRGRGCQRPGHRVAAQAELGEPGGGAEEPVGQRAEPRAAWADLAVVGADHLEVGEGKDAGQVGGRQPVGSAWGICWRSSLGPSEGPATTAAGSSR